MAWDSGARDVTARLTRSRWYESLATCRETRPRSSGAVPPNWHAAMVLLAAAPPGRGGHSSQRTTRVASATSSSESARASAAGMR